MTVSGTGNRRDPRDRRGGSTSGKPSSHADRKRRDGPPRASTDRSTLPGRGTKPLRANPEPKKPDLPDEEPQLPRAVMREIDRVLGRTPRAREVALALSVGSAAIDEGLVDVAVQALAWAKHQAPRVVAIREAYGVALYLAENFPAALSELQAYRRMSGKADQHHLIADAERALGRDVDRVARTVEEMIGDEQVPVDRRVEGVIVWASMLADGDQLEQGRAVLRRFGAATTIDDDEAAARFDYVVGDLAERAGDLAVARAAFARVVEHDDEIGDAGQRLERLEADA